MSLDTINHDKVLVIAAHPDDEVLGCGGTIARLSRAGHQVYVAILGEGMTSRYDQREKADQAMVDALQTYSQKACNLLGTTNLFTFNLPDNRFDSVSLLDIAKIIEELIAKLSPNIVYTQHGGDLNIDHVMTYRATLTATRPQADSSIHSVFAYEVPSSTEWAFQKFEPVFRPNTFVDISSTLDLKIQAMQIYESEARAFPHPRSPEALRSIALRWGSVVGFQAAEAFELVRKLSR